MMAVWRVVPAYRGLVELLSRLCGVRGSRVSWVVSSKSQLYRGLVNLTLRLGPDSVLVLTTGTRVPAWFGTSALLNGLNGGVA